MQAGTKGIGAHKLTEQLCGYKYNAHHIVLNERLAYKSISTLFFDFMHVFCIDGVVHRQWAASFDAIRANNPVLITGSACHPYLQKWTWPRQFASGKNCYETGTLQAAASQLISVVPVLGHLFRSVLLPTGRCSGAVRTFILCTVVIELFLGAARSAECATPSAIREAILAHYAAHLAEFGEDYWAFKFHMGLHIPEMMEKFGIFLACFVLERKHKLVKRFITGQLNPHGYEMHIMRELTAQHLADLKAFSRKYAQCLIEPTKAPRNVIDSLRMLRPFLDERQLQVSMGVISNGSGAQVWRGDYVLLDGHFDYAAGEIYFHMDDGSHLTVMVVYPLRTVCAERRWARYDVRDAHEPQLVPTGSISCAAISRRSERALICLWPLEYRAVYNGA